MPLEECAALIERLEEADEIRKEIKEQTTDLRNQPRILQILQ